MLVPIPTYTTRQVDRKGVNITDALVVQHDVNEAVALLCIMVQLSPPFFFLLYYSFFSTVAASLFPSVAAR
jgi:hypothetical protein